MRSIAVVFGAFLFSVFVEGFIRIVITFYHQQEFSLFGISSLPNLSWAVLIIIPVAIINWLSGMLTITLASFSPLKHLAALTVLVSLWRVNELVQSITYEPIWYFIAIFASAVIGLSLAYVMFKKMDHAFENQ